jgi:PTS system mannitol-specific IIC component
MGSSAMGAALLRKKIKQAGLSVDVGNCSVDEIPSDAELVISQAKLTQRAKAAFPHLEHISIHSFVDSSFYDGIINRLKSRSLQGQEDQSECARSAELFSERHILMNAKAADKWQAIRQVGDMLVRLGLVTDSYIDDMVKRERVLSTYIGNGVAIPHGVGESDDCILKPGIVIAQYPDGVAFDGKQKAFLLIAVVSGAKRIGLVSRIAFMIEKQESVKALVQAKTSQEIYRLVSPFLQEATRGDTL